MTGNFNFYCFDLPNPLDKKETYDLFIKMKNGDDDAKEKLVLHNLKLVMYIIVNKFYNTQFDFEELVSIGNIGLIKAINTFNPLREKIFSSYASTCITNEVLMFLRKNKNNYRLVSLDAPIFTYNKGDDVSYSDIIPDDLDIIEKYENNELSIIINECLSKLSDIERKCIIMHFGLYGVEKRNQKELAKKFNYTQSYVSKLISKAINKIKTELYFMGIIEDINDFSVIDLIDDHENSSTIYRLLAPYTKKEIDNVLSSLNEQEKYLIGLRYGNDLNNPVKSMFFTEKDKKIFYCVVVQKIRKILIFNCDKEKFYRATTLIKK